MEQLAEQASNNPTLAAVLFGVAITVYVLKWAMQWLVIEPRKRKGGENPSQLTDGTKANVEHLIRGQGEIKAMTARTEEEVSEHRREDTKQHAEIAQLQLKAAMRLEAAASSLEKVATIVTEEAKLAERRHTEILNRLELLEIRREKMAI